jgi:hypothetical protein
MAADNRVSIRVDVLLGAVMRKVDDFWLLASDVGPRWLSSLRELIGSAMD